MYPAHLHTELVNSGEEVIQVVCRECCCASGGFGDKANRGAIAQQGEVCSARRAEGRQGCESARRFPHLVQAPR